MINDQFSIFNEIDVWGVVKWFYVLAFLVYFCFSLLVWRQIDLMIKTLNGALQLPVKFVGVGLVIISGFGLLAALMIL